MNSKCLEVYLNHKKIGMLTKEGRELSFSYSNEYLKDTNAVKLAAAFPLSDIKFDHETTLPFFFWAFA